MKSQSFKLALLSASAITAIGLVSMPMQAAAADKAGAAPESVGEVVVQARHRNESVIDTPLAISVVTAAKMQQLDIKSVTDLANYTPGLEFNNFTAGDARNDRGPDRPIIMRGMNLGIGNGAGASLFLDGADVAGNEIPADMDVGTVEVLRGPQSVYFGRSTLTGAVSYRTKSIGNEWGGEFEAKFAQNNERDLQGTIAGAIIPDKLKIRLTGLSQSYGGYVTNDFNNGASKLGATSRNSVSATAVFTPTDKLEFKAYVNYFKDDDGPAATAFIPGPVDDNCTFPGAAKATVCGQVPDYTHSVNYSNTMIPGPIAAVIFSTPIIQGAGFKQEIGTQRAALLSHIVGTWDINDYIKLTSITAYHNNVDMSADDGDSRAPDSSFTNYQNYMYTYSTSRVDYSQEFRLTSDPTKRLSWTFGGNYYHQVTKISAFVGWNYYPLTVQPLCTGPCYASFKQNIVPSTAETFGLFGGLYFKATDHLTVSAEARRQTDRISVTSPPLAQTFTSFSPRVSLTYDVGGHRNIYASYSEGTAPGGFNTSIDQYKSNTIAFAQIQSLLGVTGNSFKEMVLKIEELGFKGNFAEGKGFFDINLYYGKLTNQQLRDTALIPALGFSVSVTNNAGQSTIYGVEYQGSYNFDKHLSMSTTFAWNHTKRDIYFNPGGVTQFGTTNFNGKSFAQVPEFSGSFVMSYNHPITETWGGFGNMAVTYRGKEFMDDYNAAYIPGRFQVDARLGLSHDQYKFELFGKNLLDDRNYTGGGITNDFAAKTAPYTYFGGWAAPRQVGIRVSGKF